MIYRGSWKGNREPLRAKKPPVPANRLVQSLRRQGQNEAADRLERLLARVDGALERTSWWARSRERLRAVLSRHARYASLEWAETTHLLEVARRLLVERKPVSERDRELARQQFLDVLKTVPASAILAGTFLLPIPGAQPILAPILMQRLGLLPSSWSESDAEKELRDLVQIAQSCGLPDVAAELGQMLAAAGEEARKIEELDRFVRANRDWIVLFDENLDSRLTRDELARLRRRIQVTAVEARTAGERREWYVYYRDSEVPADPAPTDFEKTAQFRMELGGETVKGPYTLPGVMRRFAGQRNALVRRGAEGWWVPLWALQDELSVQPGGPSPSTSMQSP